MVLASILAAAAVSHAALPPVAVDMAVGNSWNARLPRDLAAAATAYDLAQIRGDKAALQLLAWDYTLANSSGQVETKGQFIAEQTAPGYRGCVRRRAADEPGAGRRGHAGRCGEP